MIAIHLGLIRCFTSKVPKNRSRLTLISNPGVIISASGMMEAGRVKHHIANNIEKSQKYDTCGWVLCADYSWGADFKRR